MKVLHSVVAGMGELIREILSLQLTLRHNSMQALELYIETIVKLWFWLLQATNQISKRN